MENTNNRLELLALHNSDSVSERSRRAVRRLLDDNGHFRWITMEEAMAAADVDRAEWVPPEAFSNLTKPGNIFVNSPERSGKSG